MNNQIILTQKNNIKILKTADYRTKLKKSIKIANTFEEQMQFQKKLQKLSRSTSKARFRTLCWKTGRTRSVYQDFRLSRQSLREMAHNGFIPGIIKSS
uniref:Ribosomal protein S14 n=1 Tax=Pterocladiophila hemisphaerica TaxID=2712948 RepID=A0A6M3WWS0_9FLOR|nr:ribosomal protein S14 [Pterocladiophila hemisphaerica]